jgi:abortive infection bacteriophage resistance protein
MVTEPTTPLLCMRTEVGHFLENLYMSLKKPLSISDQLDLLHARGMIIDDFTKAHTFLECNHYYRLNIYFHKFMDSPDHFKDGIQFSQIISVYENDRWLRNKILSILERIEIETRTRISYYLALTYGSSALYDNSNFKDNGKYNEFLQKFNQEIAHNRQDPVVIHHQQKYGGQFPVWVAIEYLSFNTLSKLYKNLLERDKKVIANGFYKTNDYLLGQWLHVLSILRNICAHYGYLFHRKFSIRPIIPKIFKWKPSQNSKLFAQFLVISSLSDRIIWESFMQELIAAEKNREGFDLTDYGFPRDWHSYLC